MTERALGSGEDREYVFYKFIFRKKTLLWTFLFWLGLKTFGAHFVYLERYQEALIYFIFITLFLVVPIVIYEQPGGFIVLIILRLAELFYLPFLVKNSNKHFELNLRKEFGLENKS